MGGDSVPSSRGAFSLSGGANGGASAEPACGRARSVVTLIVPDPVDLTVPRRGMEWMRPGQAPSRGCTCTARGEGGRNVSRSKHWSRHRGTRTNDALADRQHVCCVVRRGEVRAKEKRGPSQFGHPVEEKSKWAKWASHGLNSPDVQSWAGISCSIEFLLIPLRLY